MQSGGAVSFFTCLCTAQPHWDMTLSTCAKLFGNIVLAFELLNSGEKGWKRKDFFSWATQSHLSLSSQGESILSQGK